MLQNGIVVYLKFVLLPEKISLVFWTLLDRLNWTRPRYDTGRLCADLFLGFATTALCFYPYFAIGSRSLTLVFPTYYRYYRVGLNRSPPGRFAQSCSYAFQKEDSASLLAWSCRRSRHDSIPRRVL